jgi:HSP90 family molecular chaperone
MRHAVAGFVDGPRAAVEEADHVMEEIAARFTEAMAERRRDLRRSWEATDESTSVTTDTEQLRLALRDYRELADRLLHR